MRHAEHIVNLLLEETTNGTTMLFGPSLPLDGQKYLSLEASVEHWRHNRLNAGQKIEFTRLMAEMIGKGHTFVLQKSPGSLVVFSQKPQVYTGEGALEHLVKVFGIEPTSVVTYKQAPKSPGKQFTLQNLFVERKKLKEDLNTRTPVSFGIALNKKSMITSVDKASPAARAGLQVGDRIIQVGPFESGRGVYGPWRIKSMTDFKRACPYMEVGHTVPMRVIRGDGSFKVAVVPSAQAKSKDGAQVDPKDYAHFTVDEIAKAQRRSPEAVMQMLKQIGGKAKDFSPTPQDNRPMRNDLT